MNMSSDGTTSVKDNGYSQQVGRKRVRKMADVDDDFFDDDVDNDDDDDDDDDVDVDDDDDDVDVDDVDDVDDDDDKDKVAATITKPKSKTKGLKNNPDRPRHLMVLQHKCLAAVGNFNAMAKRMHTNGSSSPESYAVTMIVTNRTRVSANGGGRKFGKNSKESYFYAGFEHDKNVNVGFGDHKLYDGWCIESAMENFYKVYKSNQTSNDINIFQGKSEIDEYIKNYKKQRGKKKPS